MHENVSEHLNQQTIESWSNCTAEFLSTRKQQEDDEDEDEDDDANHGGNDNDEEEDEGYSE